MRARNKILQKRAKSGKQALRKGFKPIPNNALGSMLTVVNAIPSSIPTPPAIEILKVLDPEEIFEQFEKIKSVEEGIEFLPPSLEIPLKYLFNEIQPYLPSLVEKYFLISGLEGFQAGIDPRHFITDQFTQLHILYEYAVLGRKVFGVISELNDSHYKIGDVKETFSLDMRLFIDDDGTIQFHKHPLVYALEGVDHTRIKQCPVCGRFFWAGRITQQCCSPRCSNTFRVRRHRFRTDEEKGELKIKRYKRETEKLKPRGKNK